MTQDYKDENTWLMLGDCLERMKEFPDDGRKGLVKSGGYADVSVGDEWRTNYGGVVTVIDSSSGGVTVEFNDLHGYTIDVTRSVIKSGNLSNPYHRSLCGVGYIGIGKHKASVNGVQTKAYSVWNGMIRRCYTKDKNVMAMTLSYRGVTVCEDWYNFQKFADWYYLQPNNSVDGFQLDKDLRVLGSKEYNPINCSLVPSFINSMLGDGLHVKAAEAGLKLPRGVRVSGNKYSPSLRVRDKLLHLGVFDTIEEASELHCLVKEEYVRVTAMRNIGLLDKDVYRNLSEYTVTDMWRF